MRYRSSLETSYKILRLLAMKKEYAQYDMPKAIGKNYRTILRHLHLLEKYGFIQLARTERSKKGGKDRKIYTITLLGLNEILYIPKVFDNIDKIAKNYADLLPLIFGKWDFFEKHGLKDSIMKQLYDAAAQQPRLLLNIPDVKTSLYNNKRPKNTIPTVIMAYTRKAVREPQKNILVSLMTTIELTLTRKVLFNFPISTKVGANNLAHFLSILKQDNNLKHFIDSQFQEFEKQYSDCLSNIRSWRKVWANLS